jgi:hypothetical protein
MIYQKFSTKSFKQYKSSSAQNWGARGARNKFFLNWAKNAIIPERKNSLNSEQFVSVVLLQGTPEEMQNLKKEIMVIH